MEQLELRVLEFLYKQVEKNNIPHIRKNMVQEYCIFIIGLLSEVESQKVAQRMKEQAQEEPAKSEG